MFNRIRLQLTIRNAAVLSVILIILNVSVYGLMKQMLFSQVDRSLIAMRNGTPMALSIQKGPQGSVVFRAGQMDRPMIQLVWTDDNRIFPSPASRDLGPEAAGALKPTKFSASPQTVKLGSQYFRVLTVVSPGIAMLTDPNGGKHKVAAQQLLSNVSAEMGMLRRLFIILLTGGCIGLLIAVAAGYYLANRALIPVRLSMKQQQQFASDASHELRTPLAVIQTHSELMLRHPEHTIEQDSQHISIVLQEARRMSRLVADLLTLARTDSNQLELEIKPVRFDLIVQDVVGKMRMLAEVKGIMLEEQLDSRVTMQGDEGRLHQLVVALLDNAIKYTSEGGYVRVICRQHVHSIQLEVEDTGIGIAPDSLPHIFDRFFREDKARSRHEGGTGLGLAIAKWIVESHGGRIRVESKLAAGTQVHVSLPHP